MSDVEEIMSLQVVALVLLPVGFSRRGVVDESGFLYDPESLEPSS